MQTQQRGFGWLAPTPRLIAFIILSILFTLSSQWIPVLVSSGAAIILLILGGKYPRAALIACFSAFVLTFLGNALFAADNIIFSFLVFNISPESLWSGLRLGIRISAMILIAIAFIAVTPLHELLKAFRGLRIPAAAEMYLTIVLRYVDILWYDIQISMKAMAVRGVNWEGGIGDKIPAFSRLMLPLIFRILDHIDGQSLAIDNRGGVNTRRESLDILPNVPAITMKNVFVRYDSTGTPDEHVLTDLDFEIEQSKGTVLLGRIGAGKTSTLLLCTGLIPYSVGQMKGDVTLFGHNTKTAPLSKMGRLARIVFPSAVQGLVGLTVHDELSFSLRSQAITPDESHQAMIHSLEIVGLDESFLPRLTLGLSGGEMQRVALASAIVAQPRLLALDDVTVQLDPVGKREVIAALHAMQEGKMTTVMCDPHVELLAEIGDRFISLETGHVVGDETSLTAESLGRASLRVPQMLRLGQKLGIKLPSGVSEALPALKPIVNGRPPSFSTDSGSKQEPIVSATNLVYTYPNGPTAIDGLNINFHEGEFVAILGSNGSGKTTVALMLAGALTPTRGEIHIANEPFDRSQHRGYIGYVFQEPVNQIVTMKVADELAFGPTQLGWTADEVEKAVQRELHRYDLSPEAVPLHLTPANARKLAIAATLTMNPRMIILDEPTNNLDETETEHLMNHLQQLQAEGKTVVVITHDVDVACQYADRVIVMTRGDILLDGPTRQVMAQPDLLIQSDVVPPAVVTTALALWPNTPPALTVDELASAFKEPTSS